MKIFSWMQSKAIAKQDTRKRKPISDIGYIRREPLREEFSDWPHALLAIGTLGNKEEPTSCKVQHTDGYSDQNHLNYVTLEEVEELEKELKLIFDKQVIETSSINELETRNFNKLESSSTVLFNRGNDSHSFGSNNKTLGKKSLSFLLNKMFLSRIKLGPSLRHLLQESTLEKSRINKMFRDILNKKVFPQTCSTKGTNNGKIYLKNRQYCTTNSKHEMTDETENGSKWVNTDSEFIVLEI